MRRCSPVFHPLNGSWATYYRLAVPQILDVERFLYVDADTLCEVDVSGLNTLDLGQSPAGLVPEAPLAGAALTVLWRDNWATARWNLTINAGIILVNVAEWRRQRVTEQAMEYLAKASSALLGPVRAERGLAWECNAIGRAFQLHRQHEETLAGT